jgi:hypothetical protein
VVAPGGVSVEVPAIEIEFAGRGSYRDPGSGVVRFAESLWFRPTGSLNDRRIGS